MAYHGGNDDRRYARQIHRAYLDTLKQFVRWLVDGGRQVRLVTGDAVDESVVAAILADLQAYRPGLDPSRVVVEPMSDLHDLMRELATVDTVVATRYHNVLCALKLCKPTLSIGYAAKHDVLMSDMGLGDFCRSARALDVDGLIELFTALEERRTELADTMIERDRVNRRRLAQQFADLSAVLLGASASRDPYPSQPVLPGEIS